MILKMGTRSLKRILLFILLVLLCLGIVAFWFLSRGCSNIETQRIPSPNSLVDLVINESDCGATTSKGVKIHIVDPKAVPRWYNDEIFFAESVDGLEVRWLNNESLQILYSDANIYNFRNRWIKKRGSGFQEINILLNKK